MTDMSLMAPDAVPAVLCRQVTVTGLGPLLPPAESNRLIIHDLRVFAQ